MKKLLVTISVLLCFLLVGVSAENDSTQLNYTVESSYTWAAPANITFQNNINSEAKTGTLSVTENIIENGKKLHIIIDPAEDFLLTSTAGDTRTYVVKKGSSPLAAGATVIDVLAGTNTGSQELSFELQSVTTQKAGTYTGVCNFVASIVNAN